ncbi:MAG TPA: S41 family peptidase [Cyclobacteriaceae bacterium]|nr:S41 family peptidase [Cyclobacteriaceae bacterium]
MKVKKRYIFSLAFVAMMVGMSFTPPAERYFEIAKNLDIFASLFKEVNALYVDEVNPNKLMRTGIDAMLNSLDPYTNYIPEDEVEDFRTMNTGQYGGIGAITRQIGKRTVVTMIYEGYPAARNGLKIGDEILKMDDIDLSKLTMEEANHLMRGQIGTNVRLTVKRPGATTPVALEFKRERVKVSNVPYFGMVSNEIGFVQLSDFTPDAGKEVKNAIVALKEKGAKGIILDLRGNPGGLLLEAVNICSIFLPKGNLVVSTKGKVEDSNFVYETTIPPVDTEIPLAVLINRGSASASEIVAGTLQDYDRAIIVGEKSYGKGLVQLPRPLSYNSQVKITTAKYYTAAGRCIQVLDYAHRRMDGSVGAVPDSLKKSFKTSHGRTVFDGGGIDPDIATASAEASAITQTLYSEGFLFDFATEYYVKHPTITTAKDFAMTDAEYTEFVAWMKTKKYSYLSPIEVHLNQLTEEAKRERAIEELKPQIDKLKSLVTEYRKNDLTNFKDQIRGLLEEDIVAHYYLERGATEVSFKSDQDVRKSIEALNDAGGYKKILNLQ